MNHWIRNIEAGKPSKKLIAFQGECFSLSLVFSLLSFDWSEIGKSLFSSENMFRCERHNQKALLFSQQIRWKRVNIKISGQFFSVLIFRVGRQYACVKPKEIHKKSIFPFLRRVSTASVPKQIVFSRTTNVMEQWIHLENLFLKFFFSVAASDCEQPVRKLWRICWWMLNLWLQPHFYHNLTASISFPLLSLYLRFLDLGNFNFTFSVTPLRPLYVCIYVPFVKWIFVQIPPSFFILFYFFRLFFPFYSIVALFLHYRF